MKPIKIILTVFFFLVIFSNFISSQTTNNVPNKSVDKGHFIFNKMLDVYTKSNTLSYSSHLTEEKNGKKISDSRYNVKLKRDNFSLIEASTIDGKYKTNIIQRGDTLYLNWPTGFQWYYGEDTTEAKKIKDFSYMRFVSESNKHSIGHMIQNGVVGISYLFQLNPSYFHGYANETFLNYDSVNYIGEEIINNEKCYVIEVSLLDNQRKLFYWISQNDYFPRKMVQELQLSSKRITTEILTDIKINHKLDNNSFSWMPPPNWVEQKEPTLENNVIESGTVAKNFEYVDMQGNLVSLKNLLGKVVWLNNWRIGCPPCRVESPFLEKTYQEYKDKGLVIIGLDFADDEELVEKFIDDYKLTYPNVVDTNKFSSFEFNKNYTNSNGIHAWPLNYIIDKNGIIVDGWYGFDSNDSEKYLSILNKLLEEK